MKRLEVVMNLDQLFSAREFKAAIVDLDGTLVDTLGDFEQALASMLVDLRLQNVEREFIQRTVGKGSEYLIRRTLVQAGGCLEQYDEAWEYYERHYLAINGRHSSLYPGAAEGLERLRAGGVRLACLTNKPLGFAKPLLADKGIAKYFDRVFGGDSFERKKPDPQPLVETCRALGTRPDATLMIGDSANDAAAARAAGCPVVLVTYGYNHGQPVQEVDADGYIDRIDLLPLNG